MELKGTFSFPEIIEISPQLERILNQVHSPLHMVALVERKPFDYRSTSPAEIITCRLSDDRIVSVFCKYSGAHTRYSYGHRGGVEYETKVYKTVLQNISLSTPHFYGTIQEHTGAACLVIQYLEEAELLKDQHDPKNFAKAAAWVAELHRRYESSQPPSIKAYDTDYYLIWLSGVEKISRVLKDKHPWLPGVCSYFRDKMHLLSGASNTFIHGEYYTKNILVQHGTIYPIDWESAAIGPGEIDLASLIEGWDDERKRVAMKTYVETRWPDGNFQVDEFREKLLLAKIYLFLRWTGEYDDPAIWVERTNWFENFYQLISKSGYQPLTV